MSCAIMGVHKTESNNLQKRCYQQKTCVYHKSAKCKVKPLQIFCTGWLIMDRISSKTLQAIKESNCLP